MSMTPLRKKRLLILADTPHDHKKYYSQYLELEREGLTGWVIGYAYLTEKGKKYLASLENV